MALLAKAGSYGGTLLLNDGALVGYGLGGADIANELLYYNKSLLISLPLSQHCHLTPS